MHFQKPPLGTPLDWEHPFNKDLALHLAMNEGHGDKVQDPSMNGNHGTLNNFAFPPTAASGWNPGQTGVGVNFDGTDDFIDCGNDEIFNFGINDWLVSTWVDINEKTAPRTIMAKGNHVPATDWLFYIYDNQVRLCRDGDIVTCAHTIASIDIGTWNLFCAGRDGNDGIIFINGIEVKRAINFWQGYNLSNTHHITIGAREDGTTSFFNGGIDQPRIHNRVPIAKEVMDYYINPWQVYLDE